MIRRGMRLFCCSRWPDNGHEEREQSTWPGYEMQFEMKMLYGRCSQSKRHIWLATPKSIMAPSTFNRKQPERHSAS